MTTLCLHRTDSVPYYCVKDTDHEGDHDYVNARVIIKGLEDQLILLQPLALSDEEKDALSKAIHFRIPQLQRSIQQVEDNHPEVARYADAQLQALIRIATRHEVP